MFVVLRLVVMCIAFRRPAVRPELDLVGLFLNVITVCFIVFADINVQICRF